MPLINRPCVTPGVEVGKATLPLTYSQGLEYSAPARGTWTIMHLGLLIPETHIIFVCARCCLRGVSMSAAELRAMDRFSTITIEDSNLLEGNTERILIDGVTDIIRNLAVRPKGVIIYTSCVHEFVGSDLTFSFEKLRETFPDIAFADGYMTPILRKRITPDMRNRRQIYTMIRKAPDTLRDNGVTIAADVRPLKEHSDVRRVVQTARRPWRTITAAATWEAYQALARSEFVLTVNPSGKAAREWMAENLGMKPIALSCGWDFDENEAMLTGLAATLGAELNWKDARQAADAALKKAQSIIGDTPVAIDYTATMRPLSLTRLLIRYGFNVVRVYCDTVFPQETADFEALKTEKPALRLMPTTAVGMVRARTPQNTKTLAVGQKAAWFEHTDHFVNMVENDGADGFSGITYLAQSLTDAFLHPKNARDIIQIKALGCSAGGCL